MDKRTHMLLYVYRSKMIFKNFTVEGKAEDGNQNFSKENNKKRNLNISYMKKVKKKRISNM